MALQRQVDVAVCGGGAGLMMSGGGIVFASGSGSVFAGSGASSGAVVDCGLDAKGAMATPISFVSCIVDGGDGEAVVREIRCADAVSGVADSGVVSVVVDPGAVTEVAVMLFVSCSSSIADGSGKDGIGLRERGISAVPLASPTVFSVVGAVTAAPTSVFVSRVSPTADGKDEKSSGVRERGSSGVSTPSAITGSGADSKCATTLSVSGIF